MKFTDLSIIMEEIETAFAAATTAGVDFTYSTGRNGDFVNFLFRERSTTTFSIVRVPEFTATYFQYISTCTKKTFS